MPVIGALAHLQVRREHRDRVVGREAQVGLERRDHGVRRTLAVGGASGAGGAEPDREAGPGHGGADQEAAAARGGRGGRPKERRDGQHGSGLQELGGVVDPGADALVGGAPADVGHPGVDVAVGRASCSRPAAPPRP